MEADVENAVASQGGRRGQRSRGVPGSRTLQWTVSLQPRTTRPAVCRSCHQYFAEGDTRLCTASDRKYGRFLHVDCLPGGIRADLSFTADSVADTTATRVLSDRVQHASALAGAAPLLSTDTVESCLLPPSLESPLPSAAFFQGLSWADMRCITGDTFVQVPQRLEDAFCEALAVTLREINTDLDSCVTAWKAFLMLTWLLLYRPRDIQDGDSCASLLTERLDRFWHGDVEAIYREHCSDAKRARRPARRQGESDKVLSRKVKTLARANECGRALRALDGVAPVSITPAIANELIVEQRQSSMSTEVDVPAPDIDEERLAVSMARECAKQPRLAAPGPLQMRNEHLMLLAGSSACDEILPKALLSLALGTAPQCVIEFLRGGSLIPAEKGDGTHRPLTLSNVLRRGTLKALLKHHKSEVAEVCR